MHGKTLKARMVRLRKRLWCGSSWEHEGENFGGARVGVGGGGRMLRAVEPGEIEIQWGRAGLDLRAGEEGLGQAFAGDEAEEGGMHGRAGEERVLRRRVALFYGPGIKEFRSRGVRSDVAEIQYFRHKGGRHAVDGASSLGRQIYKRNGRSRGDNDVELRDGR